MTSDDPCNFVGFELSLFKFNLKLQNVILIFVATRIRVGQVAQAARRLATDRTARVRSQVADEWRLFSLFVSRLVLESIQPTVK